MNNDHLMTPLKDLNLTNRFLFDQVMEDTGTLEDVLSIILEKDIHLLFPGQTEKEQRISPLAKSVRMDVFSMDEEQTVYNTEMQTKKLPDLAKRSRYYQSLMDTSLLEPGNLDYNQLNNSYLIMIMTFDLFGAGKYRYTFRSRCEEAPDCLLKDGATRIFLNTKGQNDDEVSEELVEFLKYAENTTALTAKAAKSPRLSRIHQRVCTVRASEEIGVKYMQAWEEKYYDKKEAREEGLAEGLAEGRSEGLALGRAEGEQNKLRQQIEKKLARGKSVSEIAEALEEEEDTVRKMIQEIQNGREGK